MAGTISSMGEEIEYQIDDLPRFCEYLRGLDAPPESERGGGNCVFVGAGDSFAAAKAAEYVSGFRARTLDPYDLCLRPEIVKGKHLYVVSVSGRTRTNIEAARVAHGVASRTTAITSDKQSVLAESCDDLVELRFRRTGDLTPGTGSFTASLLACYSRVRGIDMVCDLRQTLEDANKWSDTVELPPKGTVFIVGTGLSYSMSIYGAAKIYEVLGWKSQYQTIEQFSHTELFSLSEGDFVLLVPDSRKKEKTIQLKRLLVDGGWNVAEIDLSPGDAVGYSLQIAMYLQVLAWRTALRLGLEECSFKRKRMHLHVSDAMIY